MSDHQMYQAGEGVEIEALPADVGFREVSDLAGFDPIPGVGMSMLAGAQSNAQLGPHRARREGAGAFTST